MYYQNKPQFPKDFLWGASSAAWQIEGAAEEEGKSLSIIDLNSRKKAPYADSSVASDLYHHYKEDVALMKEMGFKSYRFSMAWPRIFPNGTGEPNPAGVRFYHALLDELLAAGINPIVTLYHYDLPVCLQERYGGWANRQIIEDFDRYVRFCFREYGDKVKYWLSINEQNMQIFYGHWLGLSTGVSDWEREKWNINHYMNLAHAKACIACHELVPDGKIGPVPGMVPIYPLNCDPKNMIAAMNAELFTEKLWTDTYAHGKYPPLFLRYLRDEGITLDMQPGDEELMAAGKIDYFGINCYRSNTAMDCPPEEQAQEIVLNKSGVKGNFTYPKFPGKFQLCANPYVETTDWDWEIDPVALRYLCRMMFDLYQLPMIITENGFGAHDKLTADEKVHDDYRIAFLRENIRQIGLALEDGVPVLGYNLWSYCDLLSTGNGMAKRYGLVYINTTDEDVLDLRRIRKDSFFWYQSVIKTNGGAL